MWYSRDQLRADDREEYRRMADATVRRGSLVLYKNRPARAQQVGDKIEIELEGRTLSVRPKDVTLLHPGPLESLTALLAPPSEEVPTGEIEIAWELLAGRTTTLAELAELAYGDYTPFTAWAAWQVVEDRLYFQGSPQEIVARSAEEVAEERAAREAAEADARAWATFLERVRAGQIQPEDERYLGEVEELALGRRDGSRLLRELGRQECPENAHALLLELDYWDATVNPHPQRLNVPTGPPVVTLPPLPQEDRVDLTHLPAWAIDDADSGDPDDALSLEGDRLWVHIADVAALIPPDSPADREARGRGETLYLPEGAVPMIPPQAIGILGLGLDEISPALSFGLDVGPEAQVKDVEVIPSWVRVTRTTYDDVEARLDNEPFRRLHQLAQAREARRRDHEAIQIDLPEVKILVESGQVTIRPLPPLRSRALVREAMLMAGEAIGHLALERGLYLPFTVQDPPEFWEEIPEGLAGMHMLRRALRPSDQSTIPGPHAGLGLEVYIQCTSPLRRYLDLIVHQQLRAWLRGKEMLSPQEVIERVGATEAVSGSVRRAERLSERHWTLVYLQQHPDWQGEGVLVEQRGRRGTIIIPDLDLTTRLHLRGRDLPLNSTVHLALRGLNLTELDVHFQLLE